MGKFKIDARTGKPDIYKRTDAEVEADAKERWERLKGLLWNSHIIPTKLKALRAEYSKEKALELLEQIRFEIQNRNYFVWTPDGVKVAEGYFHGHYKASKLGAVNYSIVEGERDLKQLIVEKQGADFFNKTREDMMSLWKMDSDLEAVNRRLIRTHEMRLKQGIEKRRLHFLARHHALYDWKDKYQIGTDEKRAFESTDLWATAKNLEREWSKSLGHPDEAHNWKEFKKARSEARKFDNHTRKIQAARKKKGSQERVLNFLRPIEDLKTERRQALKKALASQNSDEMRAANKLAKELDAKIMEAREELGDKLGWEPERKERYWPKLSHISGSGTDGDTKMRFLSDEVSDAFHSTLDHLQDEFQKDLEHNAVKFEQLRDEFPTATPYRKAFIRAAWDSLDNPLFASESGATFEAEMDLDLGNHQLTSIENYYANAAALQEYGAGIKEDEKIRASMLARGKEQVENLRNSLREKGAPVDELLPQDPAHFNPTLFNQAYPKPKGIQTKGGCQI